MGVAAYNRGTAVLRRDIARSDPDSLSLLLADLNRIDNADAPAPFADLRLVQGHGGWWLECPTTGFGYWYKTVRAAIKAWRVKVTGYSNGQYTVSPY